MTKVCIVTGFTPIPDHPRSELEYHAWGSRFTEVAGEHSRVFYDTPLKNCWLQNWLDTRSDKHDFIVSRGDNPNKNTIAYHAVQHQKTEWLKLATMADDNADTFVWMDYGIFHQPGVTAAVISDFLKRVRPNDFAIPGCWNPKDGVRLDQSMPNWRFCGSLAIVPRQYVVEFDALVKMTTKARVRFLNHLTWEVNDWADVELMKKLPIRWYEADHNEKQFTNYV